MWIFSRYLSHRLYDVAKGIELCFAANLSIMTFSANTGNTYMHVVVSVQV